MDDTIVVDWVTGIGGSGGVAGGGDCLGEGNGTNGGDDGLVDGDEAIAIEAFDSNSILLLLLLLLTLLGLGLGWFLALSSAKASQNALCVIKLSLLHQQTNKSPEKLSIKTISPKLKIPKKKRF